MSPRKREIANYLKLINLRTTNTARRIDLNNIGAQPPMRPLFQAITVYLVSFILPSIVYAVFSSTVGFEYLRSHAYIFGTLLEFFFVGFLCILFAILKHDPGRTYGLTRKGLVKSLALGL